MADVIPTKLGFPTEETGDSSSTEDSNSLGLDPALVISPGNNNIVTGKLYLDITGTAKHLPGLSLSNGLTIKAGKTNSASIEVGGSNVLNDHTKTGDGYELAPGEAISLSIPGTGSLWINGTANDFISYIGN